MASERTGSGISRRNLLVGGGVGVGLVLAWGLWPRSYAPNLRAGPGETLFNAFLKIGRDGRVIVAVPQAELGQGVYTSLPQILADELGADWRTVSVEHAPIAPLYANQLLAQEAAGPGIPSAFQDIGQWALREYATRSSLMLTGGSTSIRAFEGRMREAGAAARALLSMAAADRWNAEWEMLDTAGGFVINGGEKLRFGEIAEEAARFDLPEALPVRGGNENRLVGESVPRIDLPSKVDGSAQFAGDIRLPDMVYASVRQGPIGDSRLVGLDQAAADAIAGVMAVIRNPRWVGAVATNWWAANRAVEAMRPRFETRGGLVNSRDVEAALATALDSGEASRAFSAGEESAGGNLFRAKYSVGAAPNAPLETLTATARVSSGRVEVWAPTQAPAFARAAAARVAGVGEGEVVVYPTLIGGGYGRKLETAAVEQAVIMAIHVKRPVQLVWSRLEETMQDSFRPPARAQMSARLDPAGRVLAWTARIAAPSTTAQVIGRLRSGIGGSAGEAHASAVDGSVPPYGIAQVAVDHVPVEVGLKTGMWRSGAHSYTAFFMESFIDELARQAKIEPMSFRMQMLGANPRLARVLTTAATLGGWDGGAPGSAMGIAAHSAFGSHVATVVEIGIDAAQRVRVQRAVCAVDVGRVINPEILRQVIEGGIIHGIAGATGARMEFERGLPTLRGLGALGLPRLADSPEISIEIMESDEEPGGATELGVPTIAPAIANALFALTGRRVRSLPI
jgi:isoquinoline 1-oxidoreductase beta subunit